VLDGLVVGYRALDNVIGCRDLARARDLAGDLANNLAINLQVAINLEFIPEPIPPHLDCGIGLGRHLDTRTLDLDRARECACDMVHHLELQASALRADPRQDGLPGGGNRVEAWVLSWLARPLPAAERARFVAEERCNLGVCTGLWARFDRLSDLAFEMPRLAWMLRRDCRRQRA
jgi:hypothetical protein